jgi:glycosyltransferase involved in cell wall biosynthesis
MDVQNSGPVGGWLSLHFPKLITANSYAAIRYAVELGIPPGRLHFLPNVVDTEKFKPTGRRSDSSVRLIIIGSLIQCKRFDRFLSVLARLRKEMKQRITGVIVGAGPLRAQLEMQAEALGLLPSSVEFLGSVADIAGLYQTVDICVLTSDFEGTPNVLLEAMASGLPVVATKIGGVPDIVRQGENGFMVEPDNEEGLCAALMSLINDSQLRSEMGQKGRDYVEANHSLKRLPDMLRDLYQLALS